MKFVGKWDTGGEKMAKVKTRFIPITVKKFVLKAA